LSLHESFRLIRISCMGVLARIDPAVRGPLTRLGVVLALTAAALLGGGNVRAASAAGPPGIDVVNVASNGVSRPIPRGFVGVSLEYNTVTAYEGTDPKHANPLLARLITELAPGQTPIVRIGGDSTDWTWWPVRSVRRPPGIRTTLTPSWLVRARALARSTGARLILGINLEADNARIASVEGRELVDAVGRRHIDALEIGNEPQLYPIRPWYQTAKGVFQFGRPLSYDLADYRGEFARYANVLPKVPFAGPAIGHSWLSQLASFIRNAHRLGMVSFHSYAINSTGAAFRGRDCSTPTSDPAHPTIATLLAPFASQGLMRGAGPDIALAHSRGLSFRVDEMNAITCAGTPGVSDTFASALWALNALFSMANAGVDGVNVHTWRGSAGKLFGFSQHGNQWSASVRPEYYGLLLFAQAAPAGARLVKTTQSNGGRVESWATIARDGHLRVLLINHSLTTSQNVVLHMPAARGPAELERLRAPRAKSTGGVTLGGQTFGAETTTGVLSGSVRDATIAPHSGAYSVRLPPACATLLSVSSPTH
jgi:hypothetical protein